MTKDLTKIKKDISEIKLWLFKMKDEQKELFDVCMDLYDYVNALRESAGDHYASIMTKKERADVWTTLTRLNQIAEYLPESIVLLHNNIEKGKYDHFKNQSSKRKGN